MKSRLPSYHHQGSRLSFDSSTTVVSRLKNAFWMSERIYKTSSGTERQPKPWLGNWDGGEWNGSAVWPRASCQATPSLSHHRCGSIKSSSWSSPSSQGRITIKWNDLWANAGPSMNFTVMGLYVNHLSIFLQPERKNYFYSWMKRLPHGGWDKQKAKLTAY